MKRMLILTVLMSSLLMVSATAEVTGDIPVKWSQLPDMLNGYDVLSNNHTNTLAADDWRCGSLLPVTDVHWWGSYEFDDPVARPQGFNIFIWADLTGAIPSQPDGLLYSTYVPFTEANETFYGIQQRNDRRGFQYFAILDKPFEQEFGKIYWLGIQAVSSYYWGWKTSIDHWRDNAVEQVAGGWEKIIDPAGPTPQQTDLAFELSVIPEPGTFSLLAMGGMLLLRRRH